MPKIEGSSEGPLQCPRCGNYRELIFAKIGFKDKGKGVGYDLPFLKCQKCVRRDSVIPKKTVEESAKKQLDGIKKGYFSIKIKGEGDKFQKYDSLGFKYDARDYYYIPGLFRPWNEGFLTPVFFNKDLLLYYNNHPEYRVILDSFSSLRIQKKNGEFLYRGLGINRNGSIFAWLGDLHEFFSQPKNKTELHRFLGSNINSDHDVVSDYYFNQIEVNWTESDNEIKIFELRNKFQELIEKKFNFQIFNVDIPKLINDYKSPILDEKQQVFSAYNKLNSLIIESINLNNLRTFLRSYVDDEKLKEKNSLKLMEIFLEEVLEDEDYSKTMCPFFVLYDLRILDSHKIDNFKEKYLDCKRRLNMGDNANYIEVFKKLINQIISTFDKINQKLEKNE